MLAAQRQKLGVDYGDVVLFDGAPITYHCYGELRPGSRSRQA
ncbi:hypothetical protein BRAS3809_1780022 [Bradyrhizobium sp. STM 3809]|nr:hypothetical protein BRAS3809_1780022 [Bradyrhizobium sp. STM 3809]